MKIEIINTSKFLIISDFVYSAEVTEKLYKKKYKSDSTIIQEKIINGNKVIWFVKNKLTLNNNFVIYSHTELIPGLFEILKNSDLKNLILISGQSDYQITKRLIKLKPASIEYWYANNIPFHSNNIFPLPLGINNDHYSNFPIEEDFSDYDFSIFKNKNNLTYSNFNVNTRKFHRLKALKFSKKLNFISVIKTENKFTYLKLLNEFKFNLCPWGNGIDTHRIWETLYANGVPIVKYHKNFETFKKLPIIFFDNYSELNQNKLLNFNEESFDKNILDFNYWRNLIYNNKNNKIKNLKFLNTLDAEAINKNQLKIINKKLKYKKIKSYLTNLLFKLYKKIYV